MPGAYANVMFCLLVVGAGISVALQQVLNTNLRTELGSPWWAGFISYLVGTVVMLAIATTSSQPWLSPAMIARTSAISWAGGIFGTIFIGTAILMVPRFGAATVLADRRRSDDRVTGFRSFWRIWYSATFSKPGPTRRCSPSRSRRYSGPLLTASSSE